MIEGHRKGLFFTALGVLFLTPDALLVRLIETDHWTLLFWRGLLMSLSFSLFLLIRRLSPLRLGLKGWLAAGFLGLSTTCFVFSVEATHAANTLIIIATSPLLAAFMARYFLAERLPLVTWCAIVLGLSGVLLSLADSLGRGSLKGEAFALGSAVAMASYFTTLRWWSSDDAPLAVWGAGVLTALVSLPLSQPMDIHGEDWVLTALLGGLVLPLAFGFMAVGPKYLPAAEVNLFLLGETVLGPIWVWWFLHEEPGGATLAGGAIVVGTLAGHSLYRSRRGKSLMNS